MQVLDHGRPCLIASLSASPPTEMNRSHSARRRPLSSLSGDPLKDGQPVANSRDVAEFFGKEHRNILKRIRQLEDSAGKVLQNEQSRLFIPANVEVATNNGGNKQLPTYDMTRDGFTLLVMGFTGEKANLWPLQKWRHPSEWYIPIKHMHE